uniref:Putative ovule protein n=1 Tax=Solanum chacoense TaxID=4108 RepID=A0A0V0HFH9_SOLCH
MLTDRSSCKMKTPYILSDVNGRFTLSLLQKWKRMQIAFSFIHGITLVLQHYFTERLSFVDILDYIYFKIWTYLLVFTGLNSAFLSLGLETEFAVVYKFWKLSLPLALHLTKLINPS